MTDDELAGVAATIDAMRADLAERAKHLQPGQCPGCGSYRRDGRPPLLHEHDCPWKADAPLWYLD